MDILDALYNLLGLLAIIFGTVPSAFIVAYMATIIIPILVITGSIFFMITRNRKDLIKYVIIFHIFCLGNVFSLALIPKLFTGDGFGDSLNSLWTTSICESIFTILAIITFIKFLIKLSKNRKKVDNVEFVKNSEINNTNVNFTSSNNLTNNQNSINQVNNTQTYNSQQTSDNQNNNNL